MEVLVGCCPAQLAQGVGGGGGSPSSSSSSSSSRARTERLWKEYFRDPSQWWDNRTSKTNPWDADFKHKSNKDLLWMDCWNNPSWVQDMLRRRQRTEEPCAMRGMHVAKEDVNSNNTSWEMLSLEEALASLEEGLLPQASVEHIACIMYKCTKEGKRSYALRMHAYMRKSGLEAHPSLGNQLISMLVEVGSMYHAQQVFDRLVYRNECSWNSLITGYVRCGESHRALILSEKIQEVDSVHLSQHTFVALLKACAELKDLERGRKIHADVARKGLLERDVVVGNALVSMYAKCSLLAKAHEVFDKLPVRNVVSWNALIAGYAKHGRGEEALKCFEQMQQDGISPNAITFVCSLKACCSIGATDKGQEIHAEIARKGLLETDLRVGSTLLDMYAKCGLLAKAQEVFDKLPVRNVVSWNSLIAGYAEHGRGKEALNCFEQMRLEGICPDAFTFACSLKACGSIQATDKGLELHAEVARNGLLEKDLVVGSTLVDMYAKCGLLAKAQEVFDKLPIRDVVSWTSLIAGYAEHGHGEEALNCFERMQLEGVSPNAVTFLCSLKACGSIGSTVKGQELHAEIARKGLLERDLVVGSTLVDMYAKCGSLAKAQEVFEKLSARDVVSWNALMAGYSQVGESENVFHLFEKMIGEGVKPNLVTFIIVLNACNHTGLVDKGQAYFESMSEDYGIIPALEHHACIIDLLGRAGQLEKAVAMIKKMLVHPDLVVWLTVLGACRKWGNVELGRQVFEHAVQVDEKDPSAYICMSNIYADAGMQEDANKVEAMRVGKQAWKKPEHTWWRDDTGIVHSFMSEDRRHSQSKNIHAKLEELSLQMRERGDAKNDMLCGHSEKLAIACALLNTPKGTPIRVVKNIRVCDDCHSAMALISKIEQRRIVVKDANHYHVFEGGKCDCGDYW